MQPLIPTPRTDRNGKVTIRHMSAGPVTSAAKASIPAPAAPKKKKARKKPLAKQMKQADWDMYRSRIKAPKEYKTAIGLSGTEWDYIFFSCSDVEMFDMLSVVEPGAAVLALDQRIKTSGALTDLLYEKGLDHLIVDRREMMDEAMERRLSPLHIVKMDAAYGIGNYPAETFLNACRVSELSGTKLEDSSDRTRVLHEAVLNDQVSFEQMKEIGIDKLKTGSKAAVTLDALKAIHKGTSKYDFEMLQWIVQKSSYDEGFRVAEHMIAAYGTDYMKNVRWFDGARNIDDRFKDRDISYRREMIDYNESGLPYTSTIGPDDLETLHTAGVPAKEAALTMMSESMTAEQYLAMREAGVPKPLMKGWL